MQKGEQSTAIILLYQLDAMNCPFVSQPYERRKPCCCIIVLLQLPTTLLLALYRCCHGDVDARSGPFPSHYERQAGNSFPLSYGRYGCGTIGWSVGLLVVSTRSIDPTVRRAGRVLLCMRAADSTLVHIVRPCESTTAYKTSHLGQRDGRMTTKADRSPIVPTEPNNRHDRPVSLGKDDGRDRHRTYIAASQHSPRTTRPVHIVLNGETDPG